MRSMEHIAFLCGLSASFAAGCEKSSGSASKPVTCDTEVETHQGEGTYYDADGSGNCGFPPSPGDLMVAAMNNTDYAGSAVCGACIQVQGPLGSVTVRIVDRCPECPQGNVDFSYEAFSEIAEPAQGRVPITWHYVPCNVAGNIRYEFKDGSNPWWMAVQIRNHRHPIASVEYLGTDDAFHPMARTTYNYFLEESGLGSGPYTFRVTDINGSQLMDTDLPFAEGQEVGGSGQFPPCP